MQQESSAFWGGGVGHPVVWLWASVCDADLAPPKSLRNAGLCHSPWPTPVPPTLSYFFVHPPSCSSGLGSWSRALAARDQGEQGALCLPCRNCSARKVAPAPMRLPGQQQRSKPVGWMGFSSLWRRLGGQTLPKGTERGVLGGGKGMATVKNQKLLQSQGCPSSVTVPALTGAVLHAVFSQCWKERGGGDGQDFGGFQP